MKMTYEIEGKCIEKFLVDLSQSSGMLVSCSVDHILQRLNERGITLAQSLLLMKNIINRKEFCIELYESALNDKKKNFKHNFDGLKVFYSVYTERLPYKVVFRTFALED